MQIFIKDLMSRMYRLIIIFLLIMCWIQVISSFGRRKVAIACFLKENDDILPFWLEYHSRLVGVRNIVVLDNFSSNNTRTPQILRKWQEKGLKVEWNQGPYGQKGDLTLAAFRKYFRKHDIGIPLDIDEVIIGYTNDRPNITRAAFLYGIEQYKIYSNPCMALTHYDTICSNYEDDTVETVDRVALVQYDAKVGKKIFHLPVAIGLDHGNHYVQLAYGKCAEAKHFGLLHYHFRDPKLTLEHALHDLRGFRHISNSVTAANVKDHKHHIQMLINNNVVGKHKAEEVMRYIEKGFAGLQQFCTEGHIIGNVSYILEHM